MRAFIVGLRDLDGAASVLVRRRRGGEACMCTRVGGGPGGMVVARDAQQRGVGVGWVGSLSCE